MNDIRRVLRRAGWRISAGDLLRWLAVTFTLALIVALGLRLSEQLFGLAIDWPSVLWWSLGSVGVLSAILTAAFRANSLKVARRVDEGASLRETLSTALCVANDRDPWAQATVLSAAERARSVKVREAVPIEAPRFWPVPLAVALALAVVWVAVPQIDVTGWAKQARAEEETQQEIIEAKTETKEALAKVETMAAKLKLDEAGTDEAPEARPPEPQTPEAVRLQAIKKLTSLKDRLEEFKTGEKGQSMDGLKQKLRQLRTPGEGPLTELSNELSKGNFQLASNELSKLAEKLQSGKMSEQDRKKLAEQLSKLANQLQKLSENQQALEKMLENAGLDEKMASNPQALAQALQNAQNLSEQQKQQLMEMAKAQQNASQSCQGMSQSMSQMAAGMGKQGQMGQEGMNGMQGLAGQLSQLEMAESDMAMADATMSECMSQLSQMAGQCQGGSSGMGECAGGYGTKPFANGWSRNQGNGSGGPGIGSGGSPGEQRAPTKWEKLKAKTHNQGGPIIGSTMIEGEQVRGESVATFTEVITDAAQEAAEAMDNNLIPPEYHDTVKHYFGTLEKKTKAIKAGSGAEVVDDEPKDDEG